MIGDIINTALDRLRIISQRRLNAAIDSLYCVAAQRIVALRAELAAERRRAHEARQTYMRGFEELNNLLSRRTDELVQCRKSLAALQNWRTHVHD